jgi:sec-independent protein translocase protein TatA
VPLGIGLWEVLILVGVLVLLFGSKGAPAMARRLGVGLREVKDAVAEIDPRTLLDPKDEPARAKPRRELEASTAVPARAPGDTAAAPEAGEAGKEPPAA